jgi:hypothetical protein
MTENNKDESAKPVAVKARTYVKRSTHKVFDHKTEPRSSVASDSKEETKPFNREYKPRANSSKDFQSARDAIEKKINDFFEANKESGLRKLVSASKLMEAGVHIGMSAKY